MHKTNTIRLPPAHVALVIGQQNRTSQGDHDKLKTQLVYTVNRFWKKKRKNKLKTRSVITIPFGWAGPTK
jgi:hypothetical protein